MKVRDLIKMEIDIDVYDDVCEELQIAFVGPVELTQEGKNKFGDILDLDVDLRDVYVGDSHSFRCYKEALVHCEDESTARKAAELFNSLAGYCAADDYEEWFEGV